MSDERDLRGTGDPIVEIGFGDGSVLAIRDDSYPDADVVVEAYNCDGAEMNATPHISSVRASMSDGEFIDSFELLTDQRGDTATGESTDWGDPVAYKCDGCGLTWPRGTNQTPAGDADTCPECAGGGDS